MEQNAPILKDIYLLNQPNIKEFKSLIEKSAVKVLAETEAYLWLKVKKGGRVPSFKSQKAQLYILKSNSNNRKRKKNLE